MRQTAAVGKLLFCVIVVTAFVCAIGGQWLFVLPLAVVAWAVAYIVDRYEEAHR